VPFARIENSGNRLGEHEEIAASDSVMEHTGICRNPEKGPQRKPSEANEIRPREHAFEPSPASLVLPRPRMVGIEQQVRVDEDHR
jgi:hypothetical protein